MAAEGLTRASHTSIGCVVAASIGAARAAFRMLFREGLVLPAAMAKMERDLGQSDVVQEMLTFLRGCTKGINFMRNRFHEDMAA